jgi:hypothetical protein
LPSRGLPEAQKEIIRNTSRFLVFKIDFFTRFPTINIIFCPIVEAAVAGASGPLREASRALKVEATPNNVLIGRTKSIMTIMMGKMEIVLPDMYLKERRGF